jgi:D-amino-acid dehydrogenase
MSSKVVVVGTGIIGATTALSLAEQGYQVIVIDQAESIAAGASASNGAQLSYSYTDAMASPDTLRSLPKLLSGRDPAFRFSSDINRELMIWGSRFIRNCTQSRSDKNTLAVLEVALRSRAIMHAWCRKYNFEFDHRPAGKLHLYESQSGLEKAKARVELKNASGANQKILSRARVFEIEPLLKHIEGDLAGAVYSPEDEVGDAAKFATAALHKAIELSGGQIRLGVRLIDFIREGSTCRALKTSAGDIEADVVVLCAGFQTGSLAKKLGVHLSILPISGYSLTYPASDGTPGISITDTSRKMVICRVGDKVRIAGMADMGLVANKPPAARIQTLIRSVQYRFPLAADYSGEAHPWAGIRPMTPDSRPVIRRCGADNVYVNCGHGMLGWTLAAGTADILREQIQHNETQGLNPDKPYRMANR